MNMKEKERKRAVFLHCAGPRVQDMFDILEDTGDDFETAAKQLMEYFEPRKHLLFNITSFSSCPRRCYDNYATRLRQAAVPCEFLGEWRDIGIHVQLQLIEKGKLKGVRRLLLSKPHTLEEALDFARTQEVSDRQATKTETVQQSRRASPDDEKKLYKVRPPVQSNVCSRQIAVIQSLFAGSRKLGRWRTN